MKLNSTARKRIHIKSFHSCGCSGMGGCDEPESASSEVVTEGQADIIIYITLQNLPHIYHIASLKGIQVEKPQTAPVALMAEQTYTVCEGSLNSFQDEHVFCPPGGPEPATILQ